MPPRAASPVLSSASHTSTTRADKTTMVWPCNKVLVGNIFFKKKEVPTDAHAMNEFQEMLC